MTKNRAFVSYEEASAWAKKEGIMSRSQWQTRCRTPESRNTDIPSNPAVTYGEVFKTGGGWGGFLGTGMVAKHERTFLSFTEASRWAQKEGIRSVAEWLAQRKKGLPVDIPSNPQQVYAEEFKHGGWGRYLGTGRVANTNRSFLSFEETRQWAQKEGIRTSTEWKKRCKLALPAGIPKRPDIVYKDEFKMVGGWRGFLGSKMETT